MQKLTLTIFQTEYIGMPSETMQSALPYTEEEIPNLNTNNNGALTSRDKSMYEAAYD